MHKINWQEQSKEAFEKAAKEKKADFTGYLEDGTTSVKNDKFKQLN